MQWTKEQEYILIQNWGTTNRKKLAKKLNINVSTLYKKANILGLKKKEKYSISSKNKRWSFEDINKLKQFYGKIPISELATEFKRSTNAIINKASQLHFESKPFWSQKELDILTKNCLNMPLSDLIKMLPKRTISSIKQKIRSLKLERFSRRWTDDEIKLLVKMYSNGLKLIDIARYLGRTRGSVKIKLRKQNIATRNIKTNIPQHEKILKDELYQKIQNKTQVLVSKVFTSDLWSEIEIQQLIELYPIKTIRELHNIFGNKTRKQIKEKAHSLGLLKTLETLERCFNTLGDVEKKLSRLKIHQKWHSIVLKRDGSRCQECGITGNESPLETHHIIPVRDPNCAKFDINNGICLCRDCHNRIKNREYEEVERYRSIVSWNSWRL